MFVILDELVQLALLDELFGGSEVALQVHIVLQIVLPYEQRSHGQRVVNLGCHYSRDHSCKLLVDVRQLLRRVNRVGVARI